MIGVVMMAEVGAVAMVAVTVMNNNGDWGSDDGRSGSCCHGSSDSSEQQW